MSKFLLAFRPKKAKRIRVSYHASEFSRNSEAKVLSDMGYKVRKLKPKTKTV